jgi:putative ABC transport system ATP-binding protein
MLKFRKKMKEEIIRLENVCKHYQMGDSLVRALDGVDVEINRGDFVVIIGPSGSGKSTMMNMVGALDLSTCGEIYLEGHDIEQLVESELAQIRGSNI